jgi:hemerythrin superfamily protein
MPERTRRTSTKRTTTRKGDVITIIRGEHREVKKLFKEFERGKSMGVGKQIITMLMAHTEKEEQIVYPRLKEVDEDFYYEANVEHHVADMLIKELGGLQDDPRHEAMMMVLMENVLHHVKEEESEGFKLMRKLPEDLRLEMGRIWQGQGGGMVGRRAA